MMLQIETLNNQFVEARDEIEYATEDAETTYFNESATEAKEVVGKVLEGYQQLCAKLRWVHCHPLVAATCTATSLHGTMEQAWSRELKRHGLPEQASPFPLACSEAERGKLQRSMGLKMEQLKAELEQLDHLHAD